MPFFGVPFFIITYSKSFDTFYQAKLLAQENGASAPDLDEDHETMSEDAATADDELRNILANIFIDNVRLRKQVNSVLRGGSIEELT